MSRLSPVVGTRKTTSEMLPFAALVMGEVQRAPIRARLKYLGENFDLAGVGTIVVSKRDNKYYVLDGQHRVRVAMERGYANTKTRCLIFHNLTVAEEASLFLKLNDARNVSAIDKYHIGLLADNDEYRQVDAILNSYGLRVRAGGGEGSVSCPDKILAIYRKDPDLLRSVLDTIIAAWGTQRAATEQVVIVAVSTVLGRYNGELDRGDLVKKLAKHPGGPAGLIGKARALKTIRPIGTNRAAAEIVVDTYNKQRRSGALPPL